MPIYRINTPGPSFLENFDSHYEAVRWAQGHVTLKRGWKFVLDDRMIEKAGAWHRATFVRVVNSRGKEVTWTGCVVYNTEPAPRVGVRNPWNNTVVACQQCGSDEFYEVGRSLDFNNWQCAGCGDSTSTLTETGMSR